jgi:hypothetical protein
MRTRPQRDLAIRLINAAMAGGREPLAADMMRMAVDAGIGEAHDATDVSPRDKRCEG